MKTTTMAQALGWFSIGLGLAELIATKPLGDSMGLEKPKLVRAYGARELAAGAMLLARPTRPAMGLWARVGGDLLDVATLLGIAAPANEKQRLGRTIAIAAVGGALAADV